MIDKNSFISGAEDFFIVFVLLQLSVYVCDYPQRQPRLMSKTYFRMIYEENNMTNHRGGAGNFAENPQRAAEAGSKGGKASSGNFKNNPERAVEAGRKGGSVSRRGKAQEDRV